MSFYKKLFVAIAVAITAIGNLAAQNQQSPYSRYGYGMVGDYATSVQRNMGGVGIAMSDSRQINVMNPASYAGTDSTTLIWDIGMDVTQLWSKEPGASGKSFGGGLDYMTLQFPLGKYMGGSIGLVPFTTVGYSFGSDVKDKDNNSLGTKSSSGFGGINEIYVGVAGRPFKGFTIGANIAYQFGTIVNDTYLISSGSSSETLFEHVIQVRDWNLQLGVQYTKEFQTKHRFTVGATYSPRKNFHGKTWGVYYDINADEQPDTVGYSRLKGGYEKPESYGVGLNYTFDRKFMVEGDFTYQKWADAKFEGIRNENGDYITQSRFDNRWKVALGMQYTPKERGNYLQRMTYRIGGNYTRDYIMIGDNHLKEYGASIGFGFPTLGSKTVINLGFEYKHRQASPQNLVSEDYFNITLGINFNEFAFWKDKIR